MDRFPSHPDRRALLRSAAAGIGGWCFFAGRPRAARMAFAAGRAAESPSTLVVLQLSGGNDGLSTVVPYGDDAYQRARPAIRVEPSRLQKLDEYRGLHPGLVGLHGLFQEGRLAIVEGAGYPEPNRSHFKSLEVWHTADPRGRNAGEGWIGRLCSEAFGDAVEVERVVHVGANMPYALHSTQHPAISFVVPEGYRWVRSSDLAGPGEPTGENEEASGRERALQRLRAVQKDAQASSAAVRAAAARYRASVEYPSNALGDALRATAALVNGRLGTRIVSVELDGFDTHNDQRRRHDQLMTTLDGALTAFVHDLAASEAGRATLVVAFSEFGRRVAENGSRGTDHGTAGPMFVAGARVRGGLFGKHPSLTDLAAEDLVHTTDFRSVYGTLIEACFDVRHPKVLGGPYPKLGFLA